MSAEKKKELQVAALENGTAIDHIPPSQLFKVASLLGLEKMNNTITIGNNFHSNKMGCKGMIKIADKFFEEDEINRIAMIAPNIILNIIRDYEVVEKKTVTLPDELIGLVKCNNPKCITNNEPMLSRFHVIDKEKGTIKCHYCERKINKVKDLCGANSQFSTRNCKNCILYEARLETGNHDLSIASRNGELWE